MRFKKQKFYSLKCKHNNDVHIVFIHEIHFWEVIYATDPHTTKNQVFPMNHEQLERVTKYFYISQLNNCKQKVWSF